MVRVDRSLLIAARVALGVLLLFALAGQAIAQERYNFLAVDDEIVDAAGPYYFIVQGDSVNAFARLEPFAEAIRVDAKVDQTRGTVVLSGATHRLELRLHESVAEGLEFSSLNLAVDGTPFARAVPGGIIVDGKVYVPITPVVEAFGGRVDWHPDTHIIAVGTLEQAPDNRPHYGPPRVGLHDDFTRVALTLPPSQAVTVGVSQGTLTIRVPGAELEEFDQRFDAGPLTRLYSDAASGSAALILTVKHEVSADGAGFRVGRTDDAFYVDVGPGLVSSPGDEHLITDQPAPVPAPTPDFEVQRQVVVIDAGHGGNDPGTVSAYAREKDVVLSVALRLMDLLTDQGIDVILTRRSDRFLTLQERSAIATTDRNIFVSIHANAAADTTASGIETWVFGQPLDPTYISQAIRENGSGGLGAALTQQAAESLDLEVAILREAQLNYSLRLANHVQSQLISSTGAVDRGVRQNLFYVLRTARIPAILVELGFVSNPDEGRKLSQEQYQQKLADALAKGILGFLRGE